MSDSISSIYSDYDDYVRLCEKVNEKPLKVGKHLDHEKEIKRKYGWKKTFYGYKKI